MPALSLPMRVGLAVALLVWLFVQLASEMAEGETSAFDMAILRSMLALREHHPWVASVMRDLSGLGSATVLALCTATTVGFLALLSARRAAVFVAMAVSAGAVGTLLLKAGFARLRPGPAFAELVAPGLSFPSGHAGMSAIVFLTLGALLTRTRSRAVERRYILAVATCLTLLVGLSRIALGVHWATDVLAGWAYGSAWAMAWLLLAHSALGTGHPGCQGRPDRPGQPGAESIVHAPTLERAALDDVEARHLPALPDPSRDHAGRPVSRRTMRA